MPFIDDSDISCGVDQLHNLGSARDCVKAVYEEYTEDNYGWRDRATPPAFVLFSDTVRSRRGQRLADYIKSNKLGAVASPRQRKNPNTGNVIKVWVWSLNWKAVERWAKNA